MTTRTCPHCGAPISGDDRFCGECGKAVEAPAPPATPQLVTPMPPPPSGTQGVIPGGPGVPVPGGGTLRPPPSGVTTAGTTATRQPAKISPVLIIGVVVALCAIVACAAGVYYVATLPTETPTPEIIGGSTRPAATATIGVPGKTVIGPPATDAAPPPATTIVGGAEIFSDDFSDPTYGNWVLIPASDGKDYTIDIVDGRMLFDIRSSPWVVWTSNGQKAGDLVLDVDATWLEGPQVNDFGPVLRLNPGTDKDDYYGLSLRSTGEYSFWLRRNGEWTALVDWTRNAAIAKGKGQVNHIQVKAVGSKFTFAINDVAVGEAEDSTLASGEFGMYASLEEGAGLQVAFDNFKVSEP